ncbi:MAG: hypothetical protein HY319_07880 [Armatimonadetes bacterium]|nr:hypothetical protein [Armatimonadota bacterium]
MIGDFLEQQKTRGQIESTGSFTLDFARAREKLARFQLPDPSYFTAC